MSTSDPTEHLLKEYEDEAFVHPIRSKNQDTGFMSLALAILFSFSLVGNVILFVGNHGLKARAHDRTNFGEYELQHIKLS